VRHIALVERAHERADARARGARDGGALPEEFVLADLAGRARASKRSPAAGAGRSARAHLREFCIGK
jgi:hypothetical protein